MNETIRIIIVDDHQLFIKGLAMQLQEIENVKVVGEAANGEEFLKLLEKTTADMVFMDIKMPVMDGIEATKQAVQKYPALKVVALSMFGEEEYLQSMLDAGAKGFLLKNVGKTDLEKTIRTVMGGNNFFSDEMLAILTTKFVTPAKPKQDPIKLSGRELEVLEHICKGMTNSEIGEKLFLSQRTIDGHRANLLSKVGAKNTVGLVTYAIKNKLVNLD
jgi:DNA-binding NarL/FixJ family response regulator